MDRFSIGAHPTINMQNGEWVRYEDAAAKIKELEAALRRVTVAWDAFCNSGYSAAERVTGDWVMNQIRPLVAADTAAGGGE